MEETSIVKAHMGAHPTISLKLRSMDVIGARDAETFLEKLYAVIKSAFDAHRYVEEALQRRLDILVAKDASDLERRQLEQDLAVCKIFGQATRDRQLPANVLHKGECRSQASADNFGFRQKTKKIL